MPEQGGRQQYMSRGPHLCHNGQNRDCRTHRHPHPSFRDMNCEVSCLAHKMRFWAKCLCPSRLIYGSYKPQCNGILGAAFGKQLV